MLVVKRNTYPNIELQVGDKVIWRYSRGCFHLQKADAPNILDKKYFASSNCDKDGIKPNGKPVDLVGIVAEVKSKKCVLELEIE